MLTPHPPVLPSMTFEHRESESERQRPERRQRTGDADDDVDAGERADVAALSVADRDEPHDRQIDQERKRQNAPRYGDEE
jgi:hypothetical protein